MKKESSKEKLSELKGWAWHKQQLKETWSIWAILLVIAVLVAIFGDYSHSPSSAVNNTYLPYETPDRSSELINNFLGFTFGIAAIVFGWLWANAWWLIGLIIVNDFASRVLPNAMEDAVLRALARHEERKNNYFSYSDEDDE